MERKKICGLLAAVTVLLISCVWKTEVFDVRQMRTIGILLSFLVILITEAFPVIVSSLIYCALMPMMGVTANLEEALKGYSQPIVFFTLVSFGIASALTTIPVSKRILKTILSVFGKNINSVIFAMMISCALFSSIVSNVPTCAIFMTIALEFLKMYEQEEERRRTGKTLMIAIPVSSMIGGMITPAGSSINLIAISQLKIHADISISFVEWMGVGIPISLVMLPLAWWLVIKVYKPAPVNQIEISQFIKRMNISKKMELNEKKVVLIVGIMLILWIGSSWIPQIDIMVVAILGCCAMFVPGIAVLDVNTFIKENSWDAFFLVGTVLSISDSMIRNDISTYIAACVPALRISTPYLLTITALFVFAALLIIPVATSLIPVISVSLIAIGIKADISPVLPMMTAALCACNCYLLPLDTVPLITYGKGYYTMTEMTKCTIFLQVAMVILTAWWIPVYWGWIL